MEKQDDENLPKKKPVYRLRGFGIFRCYRKNGTAVD